MRVAQVIVDVPTKQTDKPYDYLIPVHFEDTIQPGMRVIVPFGPRNIQGFVVSVTESSTFNKLREIIEPMDLVPILNEELLSLGNWLTEQTMCFKISSFQAMLPAALKAKYEKKIKLVHPDAIASLPKELGHWFKEAHTRSWEEAVNADYLHLLQKEAKRGKVEVLYEVRERVKKKMKKHLLPALTVEELIEKKRSLSPQASKQHMVLDFFIIHHQPIEQSELLSTLMITTSVIKGLVQKGILIENEQEVYRDPFANRLYEKKQPLELSKPQNEAITPILSCIDNHQHKVFLLYGVTGSGKTEVYLQSIQNVLQKGKESIVLVPEISLTPQMVTRFKERFGDLVAVLHSGLSAGEKYDEWRKIHRKEVKVVVGARSAIFAPFDNLGIIIIDEEHETSYKQEENPKYHARDVAIKRAISHQCPVVLGSATPSLESFARAKKGVYELLTLSNRINNRALPNVEIVDMREELREGNRSMFSRSLLEKLKLRIDKKEQTVLFLNKRGHSSFVMCRDCGHVVNCPHCDISLTYHRFQDQMKCHYCGYEERVPSICPICNSEHIRYFGTGTQKVEEELGKILPEAKVIRMDVDTTTRKGSHERLLNEFQKGNADILLGTQMIAKGLDFPNITLVGVLSADTMLRLPDFRSSEKTFQLLTQVSGRAGRHKLAGEVVIQTYSPEHYSIELAADQDYDLFFDREMMMRKVHKYPPFYYISLITVSHEQLLKAVSVTEKITAFVRSKLSEQTVVLGPVASPISRIKNRYRYQCLIKYKHEPDLAKVLKSIVDHYQNEFTTNGLQISIDVNPYLLM
ncbi:primosomal protein N' [Bacillus sp. 03113]|uniref:primosomal protein N' n=1 Tax=Bacillus sp. 03113 TaxID=2578211 RepID=UPI001142B4B0|nr:primosomal protein N' [Bacillus sp. 03113]